MVDSFWIDLAAKLLITGFFMFNFVLIIRFIIRDRKCHENTQNQNFQSLIFLNSIIIFIIIMIWTQLDLSGALSPEAFLALMIVFFGLPSIMFLIFIIYHTIMSQLLHKPKNRRTGNEICLKNDNNSKKQRFKLDLIRKIFHVFLFGVLIMMIQISKIFIGNRDPSFMFAPPDGSTIGVNLTFEIPFYGTQSFILMLFYALSTVFLFLETTRLSNRFHFILNNTIQRTLRKNELDTIASYAYMSVGYLFTSFLCPETVILAIFSLSAFADSAAAIFGIRYGNHKIQINPRKSWEGAIAGFCTGLITTSLFVGYIWGLAASILFLILDVVSPTILKISDNITVPVFTTLLFLILSQLGLSAVCILPLTPLTPNL